MPLRQSSVSKGKCNHTCFQSEEFVFDFMGRESEKTDQLSLLEKTPSFFLAVFRIIFAVIELIC